MLTGVLLLGVQTCVFADAADGGLPGIFRAWLAAQKKVPDLRVDFHMTKTLPALKDPVKSSGRFWSYADGRFRWETGKPASSVLVYDGATMQSWEASENQWHNLNPNSSSMRLWMDFLGGRNLTESGLLKDFSVTSTAAEKSETSVIFEPRSQRTRRYVKQIELRFNTAEARLVQMLVQQGDGGRQTMSFEAPKRMTAADRAVVPPPVKK